MTSIIKHSIKDLFSNKVRSALTVLGIAIGIASVTAMVSTGESTKQYIVNNLTSAFGNDVLIISPADLSEGGLFSITSYLGEFEDREYENLINAVHIDGVPVSRRALENISMSFLNQKTEVTASIVDSAYFNIVNYDIVYGSLFDTQNNRNNYGTVLLTEKTAERLFRSQDPTGKEVKVNNKTFVVKGVISPNWKISGNDESFAFFETDSYRQILGKKTSSGTIFAKVPEGENASAIIRKMERALEKTRSATSGSASKFTIQTQEDLLAITNQITGTVTIFVTMISAVSLFVGGIGIMNIMLVSVKERIREIGLRKAVGATNRNILLQILTESVLFSLIGAVLGAAIGSGTALVAENIAGLPATISVTAIGNAIVVSTFVGLVFGLYPALYASRLSPMEALRAE